MTMTRRGDTRARVAQTALALLREKGASGLTMRQVATRCGLSLSNVQYHYRNREQLLIGITEHHLRACDEALDAALDAAEPTLGGGLRASLLDPGVVDAAQPFRELFALARHEPAVHERLSAHYRAAQQRLADALSPLTTAPRPQVEEVASLLIAAIEGLYLLGDMTGPRGERAVEQLEAMTLALLGTST